MWFVAAGLLLSATALIHAHPGSGIVVDAQGQVYFVDTGQGVWKVDRAGKLALIHTRPYHWMTIDPKGHFAASRSLGEFDGGTFERITPAGSIPALVISSDFPVAVGRDGGLYYVPFNQNGPRELVRRSPEGHRSVFTILPAINSPKPVHWVNGIVAGPDGALYLTDNDAVRRVDTRGAVSTIRADIDLNDCADPVPGAPKLPFLRGLAVARDGTIYAAANGCRSVIAIPRKGEIRTVLRAESPWSPTDVALFGDDIYVLEYLHTPGDDRREWTPRVRKVTRDGNAATVAIVERQKK
jgi:sugar lactone lactonase YvrE